MYTAVVYVLGKTSVADAWKWGGEKESINIKICSWTCRNMLSQSLLPLTTRATKKWWLGLSWRECKESEIYSLPQLCIQLNGHKEAFLYSGSVSVLQSPSLAWLQQTNCRGSVESPLHWRDWRTYSGSVLRDKEPASLKHTLVFPCLYWGLQWMLPPTSSCVPLGHVCSMGSLASLFLLPNI